MSNLTAEVLIWLNDEPRHGPYMQRDGRFVLLGWRDITANRQRPLLDVRMMAWMGVIVFALPVLFMM